MQCLGDPCSMYLACILIVTVTLLFVQAITVGFFAEFPQPVKDAAEAIVNARYVYTCTLCVHKRVGCFIILSFMYTLSFISLFFPLSLLFV